jgi:hypothetical protein
MDPKRYANYDRTYFSGKAKPILKNFNLITVLWMLPMFTFRMIIESIYHSLVMMYPGIFFANLSSVLIFLRDLPDTLRKRSLVQAHRKTGDEYILSLKAPNY